MTWGHKIATLYISFVVFMIGMVTFCIMQNDIFLVEKEYYKEEIQYQEKIDRSISAQRLQVPVSITAAEGRLTIAYPENAQPTSGDVWLFRPSNATLDKHLAAMADGNGEQSLALAALAPGFWRVKVDWESQGRRFFAEKEITISPTR